ncbi:pseudouridylate synthase [Microbacterium saperdae]|uniref:RNA pseudouridylate synthase n=2 Tax=Microbacterium saperdae TaxID=69368 RepID=A0A543BKC8_9MICO|nr:tRNA pseudouridine32 synthase/23S rRNA pseudouridine746 synthase [Microbacterium saperdae]GGM55424.1 pseudouridylate synthase [Microbacterium saperdae]
MAMLSPLPMRDGVGATRLHLPMSGEWPTVADYMIERFFHLEPEQVYERFDLGEIVARDGRPLARDTPLGAEEFIWYYRKPPVETEIPFAVEVLYQDDDLLVVDKPHFLPTTPGGKYLQNSALVRLRNLLDIPDLAPVHRLDRATAGLLMFSTRPQSRGPYQLMLQNRQVEKVYEAVSAVPEGWDPAAPMLRGQSFPLVYRNHIRKDRGELLVQVDDVREPNAETLIELIGSDDRVVHTLLRPHTGKMHQLRVHLAALGIGILNDPFYPRLRGELPDDHDRPLQLLARELRFVDPISGEERVFTTTRSLQDAPVSGA